MGNIITAQVDYVQGHLRYGHYELVLTDEELKEFENLSEEEQESWVERGDLVVDDYSVEDVGSISNIEIFSTSNNDTAKELI